MKDIVLPHALGEARRGPVCFIVPICFIRIAIVPICPNVRRPFVGPVRIGLSFDDGGPSLASNSLELSFIRGREKGVVRRIEGFGARDTPPREVVVPAIATLFTTDGRLQQHLVSLVDGLSERGVRSWPPP